MIDGHGRKLNYLRISVTDRCNLRCDYCMPQSGVTFIPHNEILSFDEIVRLVRIMAHLGVDRIRLTGGEPLVRKGLVDLARQIKQVDGIRFLGLTTNGVLLKDMAQALLDAGVDGLNISLDTLDTKRYQALTGFDALSKAQDGLQAALALPFLSVKINCVLAPQSRSSDWLPVVGLAKSRAVDVRLIEWMPMAGETADALPRGGNVLRAISDEYGVPKADLSAQEGGPARYWNIDGFKGRVGMINAMSHAFCSECNRLRLTSTGDLKLCLFYDAGVPLKPLLRDGARDEEIAGAILAAVAYKPKAHQGFVKTSEEGGKCALVHHPIGMYQTGG